MNKYTIAIRDNIYNAYYNGGYICLPGPSPILQANPVQRRRKCRKINMACAHNTFLITQPCKLFRLQPFLTRVMV